MRLQDQTVKNVVVSSKIVDVSSLDYISEKHGEFFVIILPEDAKLRVQTAAGEIETFQFLRGYNPLLVHRIFHHAENEVTSIQIGY